MPVDRVRRANTINAARNLRLRAFYQANRNCEPIEIMNLRANHKNMPVCFNEITDREDSLNNVMRTGPHSHIRRTNRWCFASHLMFELTDGTKITVEKLMQKLIDAKLI